MEGDFSLDDLVVEEEEVRTPAITPVTILVSETEYDHQKKLDMIVDNTRESSCDPFLPMNQKPKLD